MMTRDSTRATNRRGRLIAVTLAAIAGITSCSGSDERPRTRQAPTTSPSPSAPPRYTAEHVRARLLTPEEVGKEIFSAPVEFLPFKSKKAPSCSLSEVKLPGDPELIFRQFANRTRRAADEVRYAQLIARFPSPAGAAEAYTTLRQKARSCPAKQHVPPRRVRKNFTLFPHDDTWRVNEDSLMGWQHLRGLERQVIPRNYTKYNVLHYMYDYAVRGNLLIATAYWERTEPDGSGEPTAGRATEILTKQLRKLG
ncbi:hypothetical protein [Thermomonospora cellulosilytica]|nr:hypothetical protein [Thermomonospora cellulosilytica]